MELFATIVNDLTPLTAIVTKSSVVDLAAFPRYTSLVTQKLKNTFDVNVWLCQQNFLKLKYPILITPN